MGTFVLFIVLIILVGFVAILVGFVNLLTGTSRPKKKRQSRNQVLNVVRERFGAENLRGHVGHFNVFRPAMGFNYGRTMARLKHIGSPLRRTGKQTLLEADFKVPRGVYIRIFVRQSVGSGAGDIVETGDEEFDQVFQVRTNDHKLAMQLLTDSVKWKLSELRSLAGDLLIVKIEQGRLFVNCSQWFTTGRDLLDFVQGSLELFDQLMLPRAEGLEFVRQNQAAVIEDIRCPICSDDVMHEMVVCRRCKTPHCAECWEYNGKCATFACMEDRCIRVQEQEL